MFAYIKYYLYLCNIIHSVSVKGYFNWIGVWCNGNTSLFGGGIIGSNPVTPTVVVVDY